MHLGDGAGREWLVVELGEQRIDGMAEIGLDHRPDARGGDRGDIVEQMQTGLGEPARERDGPPPAASAW